MKKAPGTRWISEMVEKDLAAVWTVLETDPPRDAIEAVGTGFKVDAGELLVGVGTEGRRYLLIPLLPGEAARTDTRGRAVQLTRVRLGHGYYLAVVCLNPDLYDVFTQFSRELLVSLGNAQSPARAASEAFDKWRALFSDASRTGQLAEAQLVGLVGELLTLEDLLQNGASADLSYWCGPRGEPHDFRTNSYALEVKTTLVRDGRIISISSVDQLDTPPSTKLFVIHRRLERDPKGFNLHDIVTRLTSIGASSSNLAAALSDIGVNMNDLAAYAPHRFHVAECRVYAVDDTAFPRITRRSFKGEDVPAGTLRISYSIDLTNEPPSPLTSEDAETLVHAIATEATNGMGA
ncbi:PD-(D/E)XK motif protein [Mycolicibacterium thermoresistibile]